MKKANNITPVILIQGDQSLLIDREIDEIRKQISVETSGLDHMVFHLDTKYVEIVYTPNGEEKEIKREPVEKIIETANIVSMYGGHKLLVARNAEILEGKDISKLNSYISRPSTDATLILVSTDKNKPRLKKNSNLLTMDFSAINKIEDKIQKEAAMLGLNISKKACSEIHKLIGDDFTSISNELIKLLNYFGTERSINEEDIENFIMKRDNESIFDLVNAVLNRQVETAIKTIRSLENQSYDPLAIVATFSQSIRRTWQVKELIDLKNSDADIMKKMRISRGALYYAKKQAGNFSIKSLSDMINKLNRIDTELKSYSQNKYTLLSRVIIDLCSKSSR